MGCARGLSSSVILEAMRINNRGHLYSIDYPEFTDERHERDDFWEGKKGAVVPHNRKPGWLIPDYLKDKWTLILGKSENELKPLLKNLGEIDIFFHDSEHSYENQSFEFNNSLEQLKNRGIIIASDISWTDAYNDFINGHKKHLKSYYIDHDLAIAVKS